MQVEPPWDPEAGGFFTTADLYISGDNGYMGRNSGVLYVIDISMPEQMQVVAQVQMPGPALDVKVAGELAVVAVQNGPINELGLVVVDVSDPPRAHILSMIQDEFWSVCTTSICRAIEPISPTPPVVVSPWSISPTRNAPSSPAPGSTRCPAWLV
tara:strand:- start:340 stop:804 length:465 start_codon:yes stop_codon:yes gene_type:complete